MNAFDYENTSNCWNSEGSSTGKKESFFIIDFGRIVQPMELRIQFQAGFSAEQMVVLKQNKDYKNYKVIDELEVDDDHDMQTFVLEGNDDEDRSTSALKLVFDEFTDFYGRVTIYQLQGMLLNYFWGIITQNFVMFFDFFLADFSFLFLIVWGKEISDN